MNVLKSIYALIIANTDIQGYVGVGTAARVYPSIVPQKQTKPYISFDCYNTEPTDTKDGVSTIDNYSSEVSVFHKNALDCLTLANLVRSTLDRFKGLNSNNVINSIVFDGNDGPYYDEEAELFRVDIDFRIRAKVDYSGGGSGTYTVTYNVNVNGVLDSSGTFDPTVDNTINITAT